MSVAELIEQLQRFPADLEIWRKDNEDIPQPVNSAEETHWMGGGRVVFLS